jgi:carbamoyltransferase
MKNKKKLSEQIKGRESYRPVAAITTSEYARKISDPYIESPFMTFAPKIKHEYAKKIPAVIHRDQTCRLQTVDKKSNPIIYKLLLLIEKKTGIPVLMNSSFNVAGEPIVDTPTEALNTFQKSKVDVLYINNQRYAKES